MRDGERGEIDGREMEERYWRKIRKERAERADRREGGGGRHIYVDRDKWVPSNSSTRTLDGVCFVHCLLPRIRYL